jgi:hypothetical protein
MQSLMLFSALALVVGCDNQGTPTTPVPPPLPNTPEGKLKGVMMRLQSALNDAQAAAGSGIKSERKASDKLLQPEGEGKPLRAEVTITSRIEVTPQEDDKAKADKNAKAKADAKSAEEKAADLDTPKTAAAIQPLVKKETFMLVYEGDQWTMPELPKGQIEKLCFEYALKGQ